MTNVETVGVLTEHQNVFNQTTIFIKRSFKSTIVLMVFLAVWELAPRVGLASPAFLPPFS